MSLDLYEITRWVTFANYLLIAVALWGQIPFRRGWPALGSPAAIGLFLAWCVAGHVAFVTVWASGYLIAAAVVASTWLCLARIHEYRRPALVWTEIPLVNRQHLHATPELTPETAQALDRFLTGLVAERQDAPVNTPDTDDEDPTPPEADSDPATPVDPSRVTCMARARYGAVVFAPGEHSASAYQQSPSGDMRTLERVTGCFNQG